VSGRLDVGSPKFGWPEADIADDAAGVVLLVAWEAVNGNGATVAAAGLPALSPVAVSAVYSRPGRTDGKGAWLWQLGRPPCRSSFQTFCAYKQRS